MRVVSANLLIFVFGDFLANGEELGPRSVRIVLLRFASAKSVSLFQWYNLNALL
jgi:hypothetical protein